MTTLDSGLLFWATL